LNLADKGYVLATIHRAENTDDVERIGVIAASLIEVAQHLPVIWPLHPRTRKVLEKLGLLQKLDSAVRLVEPIGYLDMVSLERHAAVITTDSGGVQKEAFFHKVPCVTLRDETEWVELIESGWNCLVPPSQIASVVEAILGARGRVGRAVSPYGSGDAATKIVSSLLSGIG
jgi:UDP-GlcNAc3NAcA epimerase